MDLKSFLPANEKEGPRENYWSLVIEPGWVQAGIWQMYDNSANVIAVSGASAWKEEKELIKAADDVLSMVATELPDDASEPEKTIIGVVSSWVEDEQIKKEYIKLIQKICEELSLKPVGFVVMSEAISNFIKTDESSPFNGIVVGVSEESLEVSLFRLGKFIGTVNVSRSISVVEDVANALGRFSTGEAFPSRMVLYDGKGSELEEVRQELLKSSWDDHKDVKFLHTPKIEIMEAEKKVFAVSLAGANELGNATRLSVPGDSETDSENDNLSPVDKDKQDEIAALGFAVGEDITQSANDEDDGLPQDTDFEVNQRQGYDNNDAPEDDKRFVGVGEDTAPSDLPGKKKRKLRVPKFGFGKIKGIFSKFSHTPGDFKIPGSKPLIIVSGVLVTLFVGLVASWWFLPSAEVTIYLSTSELSESLDIEIDPSVSGADIGALVIPGEEISTSVSGNTSKSATGTATVGDRATGSVTIYRVGSSVDVEGGTTLVSDDGLEFTLNDPVSIASGSASTPATETVGVSASAIGSDYNLSSDSRFRVGDYSLSDLEARNSEAFSGGSSREITAVSQDDIDALNKELGEELETDAISKLEEDAKASGCADCIVVEDSYTATPTKEEYSADVGDEASTVSLDMEVEASAIMVNKNDVIALARDVLEDRIPDGYVLRDDQIKMDFKYDGEDDGKHDVSVRLSVNLFPGVDTDKIAEMISGKFINVAEDYFKAEVPGFVRAEIIIVPKLPAAIATFPHVPGKIEVTVASGN